ncbi:hypothetical protein LCGC14_3035090, partial [marine sediment metagenome]
MKRVRPGVHILAATAIEVDGLRTYLEVIGADQWESDAPSDIEEIIEIMGRGCYKSFGTELNPNITKVRATNEAYLANIRKQGHGAVLEHGWVSFMFTDVSR